MGDDHIDSVISHIISPYPISISRMTISIWWITKSIYRIPYRYAISHIDIHMDIALMSDLLYRSHISISLSTSTHIFTLRQTVRVYPLTTWI